MFSQASDTKATPLGNWGERPGQAHDVTTPAVTIRVCSLCAQVCTVPHWLLTKQALTAGPAGWGWMPDPDHASLSALPSTLGEMAPHMI